MIKPSIFLLFLQLFILKSWSQNQAANNWFFGNNAGLNFAGTTPTILSGGALTNSLGCSAVSGTAGNLLFYTDGITVYTASHTVMANGNALHGVDASQPAIIVKQPQSNHVYYIFTVGGFATNYGLEYSVVDMSLASGAGSVTIKNVVIDNNCRDKLTAGKHCNGDDSWIVSTTYGTTNFFTSVLLSPSGLATPISSVVPSGTNTISGGQGIGTYPIKGQLKMSPNSKKIALRASYSFTFGSVPISTASAVQTAIFEFNNTNGLLSIIPSNTTSSYYSGNVYSTISNSMFVHGCEFSPNTNYIFDYSYITGYGTQTPPNFELYHRNLCDGAPMAVYNQESTYVSDQGGKRQMQLGPNGKIYLATPGFTSIGAINNPNNINGVATYTSVGASLGTATCQWGLPNFPAYYFEQKPHPVFSYTSIVSCLTASFSTPPICSNTGYSVTGYQWNFGDPSTGTNNVSFLASPSHTFSNTGSYTVSLIRYFLCNTNDTIRQVLTIANPTISVNTATLGCSTANASVVVTGGVGPYTYLWSANSQTNAISTFSSSGSYSVTVSDQGSGGCVRQAGFNMGIPSFTVNVIATPSLLCHAANNATAMANVSGGSGTYSYTWSQNTVNSSSLSGLSAGVYSLVVNDNVHNCSTSQSFTLHQANALGLQFAVMNNAACEGNSVTIAAYPSGGAGFYTYTWAPVNSGTNQVSANPTAGNHVYSLSVQDAMACQLNQTVSFNVSPKPSLNINHVSACPLISTSLVVSGANNYTWQPGSVYAASLTVTPSVSMVYTVFGSNQFNCVDLKTVQLTVYPAATVNASNNSPVCEGQAAVFTGSNAMAYHWQGPNGFVSNLSSIQFNNVQTTSAGLYTLIITDANGCKDSTQLNLLVHPLPQVWINSTSTLVCIGQMITLTALGANTYVWSNNFNGSTLNMAVQSNTSIQVTGTNTLTACSATSSILLVVKECNTIGIEEQEIKRNGYSVYPNPNKGQFTVIAFELAEYKLLNSVGELIEEGKLKMGENKIRVMSANNGLYYLVISSRENNTKTIKLVIE